MTSPLKPYESSLRNSGQILRNVNLPTAIGGMRSSMPPALPTRPHSMSSMGYGSSYSPYSSGYGYGSSYGSMPYRGSMYGGYNSYGSSYGMYGGGGYGGYGNYGSYGSGYGMGYGAGDDAESRFVQFAEERSRNTFSNVESIVRAFSSMAMMLDNTFFAMTSSFRAILGVAENFGRLRSMFGHIWHAVNIFRLFNWLYRKTMGMAGVKVPESSKSAAWNEALNGVSAEASAAASGGSNWPTLAFLGVLMSAPYLISKFLPKYEDKHNPEHWKASGIPAKAVFDFVETSRNEMTLHTNDEILLAPKSIQEEMKLTNSGWAYATCNGRSGLVPLNYIVVMKRVVPKSVAPPKPQKRVSFGEDQIFEDKDYLFKEKDDAEKAAAQDESNASLNSEENSV